MSETFTNDTHACLGICGKFLDTPIEFVDAEVAVSHYILMKLFFAV
jgi:hypothetical protein